VVGVHRIEASAPDIHKFVMRRVSNAADAADIAQQTLLLACAKLHTFRGDNVRGWLFGIAQHLVIDYYRSRSRFQFVSVGNETDGETEPALRVPGDSVLNAYESHQRLTAWLARCAEGLALEHQVAVLLADVYEYSDKDAAAELGMTVSSFKLLLHEARLRLKEISAPGRTAPVPPPLPGRRTAAPCHVGVPALRALQVRLTTGLAVLSLF
jgi:RNA polymerase sigma-70 factor (ECF subfamily)